METNQNKSMRRTRRNSQSLLQDPYYREVPGGHRDTPIPGKPRDAKMIHSIASLIRAKSKLLLLENPDTVEIYKLKDPTADTRKSTRGDLYLPAISKKAPSLNSLSRALSQSCPYLYDKRRGSFSSVTSQRTRVHTEKQQSNLKAQKEAKKSNVTVTMTYLGPSQRRSLSKSTKDELKVLQQVNGGENLCVFKGLVSAGEQFQFVSQRHRGFPFSASLFVNGMVVARISSCCEYRYAPGFQQGRKSYFRLSWLAGGTPCYRCTGLRNKYSSCQQLNNGTKENLILPLEQNTGNGTIESCPSSPLFIPAKPEKISVRRTRKHVKERNGGSTDSEEAVFSGMKEKFRRKKRKGQTDQKESKGKTGGKSRGEDEQGGKGSERSTGSEQSEEQTGQKPNHSKTMGKATKPQTEQLPSNKTSKTVESLQGEEGLTKQNRKEQRDLKSDGKTSDGGRLKDFYKECVEMSAELNQSPSKHWFKANILERCRLQKRLSSSCPKAQNSDVELSAESDTVLQPDGELAEEEEEEHTAGQDAAKQEPVQEQDLQAQLDAMMTVLSTSDEVEQLVLRNTELTDDLLFSLAGVLKNSPSEVTLLNLNLNLIGPYGAHILLDVLRVKPQVQRLHLFGNKLRDHGVLTLLSGVAELQDQTAAAAAAVYQTLLFPLEQNALLQLPTGWSSFRAFTLVELDIGGNGLGSDGVKVLASYMRSHSQLQYLGLAQTRSADLSAWKELFDSLKGNNSLTQIILDENNLGDPGVRLLADMLKENTSLRQVDLDRNGISDVGGNDIMGALLCRTQVSLTHLSLDENAMSEGLMSRIQEQIKCK
ncbi:glutamate-rich protein 3 [Poecilia formosa]|uniref:glutamate-rich protein 3 n=1 Tax=Poecilia formosa TaxID=48698 RepID=UPI0007BAC7E5|nr:PREDICTED: glutamate-rich protein 3-like [Poecilia formosa]